MGQLVVLEHVVPEPEGNHWVEVVQLCVGQLFGVEAVGNLQDQKKEQEINKTAQMRGWK